LYTSITGSKRTIAITVALLVATISASSQTAETQAAKGEVYWCLMRGKPCDVVDYHAPGTCPTCGMRLVTKAQYDARFADLNKKSKTVGIVLYRGFEVLDVYGPIEMWGYVDEFKLVTVAEKAGPVISTQGVATIADYSFADCPPLDIVMVPGGMGTLVELNNPAMLDFLRERSGKAEITASVCSGSGLLAKSGVLDGRKATTNKLYFSSMAAQSDKVEWVGQARWVDDGKFVTSSGVSAGIDMALHLIERLYGKARADQIAHSTEYVRNSDPNDDPFAKPVANK